ncbi:MAG TPA: ATPase domain-containing protein [Thermoanaerobaculia bacterium]|nr:ATPase domain-containing protein [Thermoanaerobaculia bacterium]
MSGTIDVPSGPEPELKAISNEPPIVKTDTPLPIDPAVLETGAAQVHVPITSDPEVAVAERTDRPALGGDRLISGIDLIDFGAGGLMPNHVYVVKGPGGVGKSILGLQFLARGLELQETAVLITDQKPQNVIAQATSVGFPIEDAVRRSQLQILNPSGRYFDLVESPADVMAIVQELGDYVKQIGAKRIVIDPIYTLINTHYSGHFALTLTQSLVNALEDLPVTILLVAGDEDNAELNPIIRMLEQNSFGVISLEHDFTTGGRIMRLSKLRYTDSENLTAHYRILNGRGLINYRGEGEKVSDVTKAWEHTDHASRTVLILGSQPETIRKVKEALGSNYDVQAEAEIERGVERVKREQPGLVLVTPHRSAGAIRAILDLARNSASSIAFLSPAANRRTDRVLYLRAGADDYFTEPFTPAELRARVDALVRRSGRRLNFRDSAIGGISVEELSALDNTHDDVSRRGKKKILTPGENDVAFDPDFNDRLQRNISTVSKFDTPFAVYWLKTEGKDRKINTELAQLCRQEDIICHNGNGEFVAILTGTDENGVKGFETRLNEKLGAKLANAKRGHTLYRPGEGPEGHA